MEKTVAYLGPEGTFAHLVAMKRFPGLTLVPQASIEEVFRFTAAKKNRAGIVPIENSSGGTIYDTVDELIDKDCTLSIQEQLSLNVRLALLGRKGEKIQVVYSHFAPLEHCDTWLKKHLPHAERREVSSTGEAVRLASLEKNAAAIGGRQSAPVYKLKVLQFPIQQDIRNVTQFFALGQGKNTLPRCVKTSLAVSLKDTPGSLCSFLEPFKATGVNLTRIVSRPVVGHPNKYVFFVDIDGTVSTASVRKAITDASRDALKVKTVGAYPVRQPYNS